MHMCIEQEFLTKGLECNKREKIIIIKPKIIDSENKSQSVILYSAPKLLDDNNVELKETSNENTLKKNGPLSFPKDNLHFSYILGDENSYLRKGFSFIIKYRYFDRVFNQSYIFNSKEWLLK
ncbi:MAG: hypothetical protein IKF53_00350 [Clostridia bacterium]|nr:hypothetical protein [Clostridia bacterium]